MNVNFKYEHIIAELKTTRAIETIREMIEHLVAAGSISPEAAEPIFLGVRQRENTMSTGIFGVAIPHTSSAFVDEVIIAFGRSREGIDFQALDRQPVRLVVLFVIPATKSGKHLLTLARISRLLHGRGIRSALEKAADADAIAGILNQTLPVPVRISVAQSQSGA